MAVRRYTRTAGAQKNFVIPEDMNEKVMVQLARDKKTFTWLIKSAINNYLRAADRKAAKQDTN